MIGALGFVFKALRTGLVLVGKGTVTVFDVISGRSAKDKSSSNRRALSLVLGISFMCIIPIMLILGFFIMDDFELLWYVLYNTDHDVVDTDDGDGVVSEAEYVGEVAPTTFDVNPSDYLSLSIYANNDDDDNNSSSSSGTSGSSYVGSTGIKGMYVNSTTGGFISEYLQIARDTCNGSIRNPDTYIQVVNDSTYSPCLSTLLGFAFVEDGWNSSYNTVRATLNPAYWANDGKHTLYTYNSKVIAEEHGSTLDNQVKDWETLKVGGSGFRTAFQFSVAYASIYPNHYSSGVAATQSEHLPSTVNGYGYDASTVRDNYEVDAGYLPDILSMLTHKVFGTVNKVKRFNFTDISDTALDSSAYYLWYGYDIKRSCVFGDSNGKSSTLYEKWDYDRNTVDPQECGDDYLDGIDDVATTIIAALIEDYEGYAGDIWPDYINFLNSSRNVSGLTIAGLVLGLDAHFRDKNSDVGNAVYTLSGYKSESASSGFWNGITVGYRIFKDKSATKEEAKAWFMSLQPEEPKNSYVHFNDGISKYECSEIWWYSKSMTVYLEGDSNSYRLVHSGLAFMAYSMNPRIAGIFAYCAMLNASGAECTFADAAQDANGLKIIESTNTEVVNEVSYDVSSIKVPDGDDPNGSYYLGTKKFGSFLGDKDATSCNITSPLYIRNLGGDSYTSTDYTSAHIHEAEDYGVTKGTAMYAIADGTVLYLSSDYSTAYGYYLIVAVDPVGNEPLMYYMYAHLNSRKVKVGDHVSRGDYIADSGKSYCGNMNGIAAHLHIAIMIVDNMGNGVTNGMTGAKFGINIPDDCALYYMSYGGLYTQLYTAVTGPRAHITRGTGRWSNGNMDTDFYAGTGEFLRNAKDFTAYKIMQEFGIDSHKTNKVKDCGINLLTEKSLELWSKKYQSTTQGSSAITTVVSYTGSQGQISSGNYPSAASSDEMAKIWGEASKYLGWSYQWGGDSPSTSFDCSGLWNYVFKQCGWTDISRTCRQIHAQCVDVPESELQPGDFVFFWGTSGEDETTISHMALYLGNTQGGTAQIMHSCGRGIIVEELSHTLGLSGGNYHVYCYSRWQEF